MLGYFSYITFKFWSKKKKINLKKNSVQYYARDQFSSLYDKKAEHIIKEDTVHNGTHSARDNGDSTKPPMNW